MNMDRMINELIARLLTEGSAEFSENGLNIKTTYDNGKLNISASFVQPKDESAEKLLASFEEYTKSLSDEFFLEVANTFKPGELKAVQDMLDTKRYGEVSKGIEIFMKHLKAVAEKNIAALNDDIAATEKDLEELHYIRDTYVHALHMKF